MFTGWTNRKLGVMNAICMEQGARTWTMLTTSPVLIGKGGTPKSWGLVYNQRHVERSIPRTDSSAVK